MNTATQLGAVSVSKVIVATAIALLEADVLQPLDMPRTGAMRTAQPTPQTTRMYRRVAVRPVELPLHREVSDSWAGGGLRTTPSDLVRMARAYFNGTLPDSIVRFALAKQHANDATPTGVGFGWRVGRDWRARPIAHHAGASEGARSVVMMFRDDSSAIAVQTNIQWVSSIESIAMVFAEALFGADGRRRTLTTSGAYTGTFGGEPASGTWSIAGDTGSISVPDAFGRRLDPEDVRVSRLPIRAIREGLYALVTPWGLNPLRLEERNDQVRGDVMVASLAWKLGSTRRGDMSVMAGKAGGRLLAHGATLSRGSGHGTGALSGLEPVDTAISKRLYRHTSQSSCPWNVKFSQELADDSPFRAREFIAGKNAVTLSTNILALAQEQFSAAFRKSPMKRAKLAGLRRNAAVVLKNMDPNVDTSSRPSPHLPGKDSSRL